MSSKSKVKFLVITLFFIIGFGNANLVAAQVATKAVPKPIGVDSEAIKPTERIPVAKTSDWYYERALIYYLQDQHGRANVELYKALEQDPTNVNANYLLGLLFKERALWDDAFDTFFRVIGASTIEHIPARLELALASIKVEKYSVALLNLEKVVGLMKLDKSYKENIRQFRIDVANDKAKADSKKKSKLDVKSLLENFTEEIKLILTDSPTTYRKFTIDLGLTDPVIYNELAELYNEEEMEAKSLEILSQVVSKRGGFSPSALAQVGAIYQQQNRNKEALATYEKVVTQLTLLGFSEKEGDFSTEEIDQLRTGKAPESNNKKTAKDSEKD
jgi:tetratricopeptide (TPR) repeat protein